MFITNNTWHLIDDFLNNQYNKIKDNIDIKYINNNIQ